MKRPNSTLCRRNILLRYTPAEELPLYTKYSELPPLYEYLENSKVEPLVTVEEPGVHHENHHNEGENNVQSIYGRYISYLGRS